MRTGLSLENDVFRLLLAQEWGIRKDAQLDLLEMTDYIVETRWGYGLPAIGIIQITLRGNDADKLERFVQKRPLFENAVKFYVVVEKDMEPEEAASQMSDMLDWYLKFTPPRIGATQAVFLCKGTDWKPFDTDERITRLRNRADPSTNADIRKAGKIKFLSPNGFRVVCNENGLEYAAFDADAADGPLRIYLKNYRKRIGPSPVGLVVNFVPYKDKDERLRAISVIFNATATTARNS